MKTFILIFSLFTLGLSTREITGNTEINIDTFTYDGYEGGYYFFTNTSSKAVVLQTNDDTSINKNLLKQDDSVGKCFKVRYEQKEKEDDSSQGIIVHLERA